jgi:hypothetical protein
MDKTTLVIGIICGILLLYVAQEVMSGYEAAKTWCHSYNGTMIAENETLACRFPNGTEKSIPKQVTQRFP